MPTVMWLLTAVGSWLAAVVAICAVMTAAKRADERYDTPPSLFAEPAAGNPPVNDSSGPPARISAEVASTQRPPLAARLTTSAAGGEADAPPWPPSLRAEFDRSSAPPAYRLYVRDAPVALLQWRADPGTAPGWHLSQRAESSHRLAVDPALDADVDPAPARPGSREAADLAACLSTALALDAAAIVLRGPPTPPSRPLRTGHYELHASRLPADIVPIAFPEAIITRAGDVSTLKGYFDDLALTTLSRRITILGGRLLALLPADPRSAPPPTSPPKPPSAP